MAENKTNARISSQTVDAGGKGTIWDIFPKDTEEEIAGYKAARKEGKFYSLLFLFLLVWGAFTIWEFVYDLCNMIGAIVSGTPSQAIVQLLRVMPLTLTAFTVVFMGTGRIRCYGAASRAERIALWKKRGIADMVAGAVIALYVIAGVIAGEYHSFVEGYVSPLFPLDVCLGGILIIVFGFYSVKYSEKLQVKESALPVRSDRKKSGGGFFMILSYLAGLCGLAVFIYSLCCIDSLHGNLFFNNMLILNYLTAFMMIMVYISYLHTEALEAKFEKQAGLVFLLVNAVLFGLYLLSVEIQNEAPNLNAFALLPIEFTASFNAFPVIYGLNNLVAPLMAFIDGCRRVKKQKMAKS